MCSLWDTRTTYIIPGTIKRSGPPVFLKWRIIISACVYVCVCVCMCKNWKEMLQITSRRHSRWNPSLCSASAVRPSRRILLFPTNSNRSRGLPWRPPPCASTEMLKRKKRHHTVGLCRPTGLEDTLKGVTSYHQVWVGLAVKSHLKKSACSDITCGRVHLDVCCWIDQSANLPGGP